MSLYPLHKFIVSSVLVLFVCTCGASAKTTIESLRVKKAITGWQEQKDSYQYFSPQKLFEIINGGAPQYIQQGLVDGIHQQLTSDSGKIIEIFAEDFATPQHAMAMAMVKKEDLGAGSPVLPLDSATVSFAVPAIGATTVVCLANHYYVEMVFSGFTNQDKLLAEARKFIAFYNTVGKK